MNTTLPNPTTLSTQDDITEVSHHQLSYLYADSTDLIASGPIFTLATTATNPAKYNTRKK